MNGDLAAADVPVAQQDGEGGQRPGATIGKLRLGPAPELGPARGTLLTEAEVQRRVVLIGDEDLGDVALGEVAQTDLAVDQRLGEGGKARHRRSVTVPAPSVGSDLPL